MKGRSLIFWQCHALKNLDVLHSAHGLGFFFCFYFFFFYIPPQIKCIDIKSKQCTTVLGTGAPGPVAGGDGSPVHLNEPGGLCVDGKGQLVYVADTNNHSIRVINWNTKAVSQVSLGPTLKASASRA